MTIRFEGGTAVTLGKDNQVIHNASVVVDGTRIVAIGTASGLQTAFPDAEVVRCDGKVVMPGFICAHHHLYSTMARGMSIPGQPASDFVQILERLWWRLDKALDSDDVLLSAQVPLLECIRNGTTTIIDHHASPSCRDGSLDVIESAVRQAGIRASLCYEVSDRNELAGGLRENQRFISKTGKGDGQVSAMMGLHASFTLSDQTVEQCAAVALASGTGCHVHVAEDGADLRDSLAKCGLRTVERLHKYGITGPQSIFVHCIHVDHREISRLAETGTVVVHNPESNMNNAVGAADVISMIEGGVIVGLGTDGMSSDMLSQMRCAYLLSRHNRRDPQVGFTQAPAMLLGNNSEIASRQLLPGLGKLFVGGPADLAIVDYDPPTPLTSDNFLGHLLFGLVDAAVDTTVCRGEILMRGKEFVTLDETRICARSRELASKLWKRI